MVSEYRLRRRVQFYETDAAGIVHFSWFFRYMEEAEHALWREAGLMLYKIPLVLTPQPEGGYTVTSPLLPELITEGDTADAALANVSDALAAVVELYQDLGRPLPANVQLPDAGEPVWLETVVSAP